MEHPVGRPNGGYVCPWCLRGTSHPDDVAHDYCSCCGSSTDPTLIKDCPHRAGNTLRQLFDRGVRLVRRDPWAEGIYLELIAIGGFMAPYGLIHSPLERPDVPASLKLAPRTIWLFDRPRGGWEAYTGITVTSGEIDLR